MLQPEGKASIILRHEERLPMMGNARRRATIGSRYFYKHSHDPLFLFMIQASKSSQVIQTKTRANRDGTQRHEVEDNNWDG
jgi:hypothetical protein